MRHFSRRYRCITYSARGYLSSDVPDGPDRYSQDRVRDDILAVFTGLGIDRAPIVGCSMGAFATLHFGMQYCTSATKSRAFSLTLVGCGSGAHPAVHRQFMEESVERAHAIRSGGMAQVADTYGYGPTRIQFLSKDPRGFAEYTAQLAEHSAAGAANTMEGYQGRRPCLYALTERMARYNKKNLLLAHFRSLDYRKEGLGCPILFLLLAGQRPSPLAVATSSAALRLRLLGISGASSRSMPRYLTVLRALMLLPQRA